jgi:hypothetical protein
LKSGGGNSFVSQLLLFLRQGHRVDTAAGKTRSLCLMQGALGDCVEDEAVGGMNHLDTESTPSGTKFQDTVTLTNACFFYHVVKFAHLRSLEVAGFNSQGRI